MAEGQEPSEVVVKSNSLVPLTDNNEIAARHSKISGLTHREDKRKVPAKRDNKMMN